MTQERETIGQKNSLYCGKCGNDNSFYMDSGYDN